MKIRRWFSREARLLSIAAEEADPAQAIAKLARDLIDETGIASPPFRPCVLASYRDVADVRRRPMRSAARLVPEDGKLYIDVNQEHSTGKQNFSADHEVVHTLFPTYTGQAVDDPETGLYWTGTEEEQLCDIGASRLLLDPRWLASLAHDAGPSLQTLTDMANLFAASLQATAFGIAELGLWPCAFVLWEWGYRKDERVPDAQPILPIFETMGGPAAKLRVASCYPSPSFPNRIELNKSVDSDSLIGACIESGERTWGEQSLDLGHGPVAMYCENDYLPYKRDGQVRPRVISFLLPSKLAPAAAPSGPTQHQLEIL